MGEQWSQFSQCLEEGTPGSGKQNQRRESGPARTPPAGSFMLPPRAAGPPAPPTDREPLPRHAAAVARARRPRGPSEAHPRAAQRPTGRYRARLSRERTRLRAGARARAARARAARACVAPASPELLWSLDNAGADQQAAPGLDAASAARAVTLFSGTPGQGMDTFRPEG